MNSKVAANNTKHNTDICLDLDLDLCYSYILLKACALNELLTATVVFIRHVSKRGK